MCKHIFSFTHAINYVFLFVHCHKPPSRLSWIFSQIFANCMWLNAINSNQVQFIPAEQLEEAWVSLVSCLTAAPGCPSPQRLHPGVDKVLVWPVCTLSLTPAPSPNSNCQFIYFHQGYKLLLSALSLSLSVSNQHTLRVVLFLRSSSC